MGTEEKNYNALKLHRADLYECLLKCEENVHDSNLSIYKEKAKDETFYMCVKKENEIIRLSSTYSPQKQAERWSNQYHFTNMKTVVEMFGLGSGGFARELMYKLKEDDVLLIYEPDRTIFEFCLKNFDLEDILNNRQVYLFVEGINEQQYESYVASVINWFNVSYQTLVIHPKYHMIAQEKLIWMCEKIKYMSEIVMVSNNTDAFFGKKSISNMMRNLKYIPDAINVNDLKRVIPKDIPAIIVAAGPSLRKNIEYLKKAKGKAVIIAVDSALKFLEKNNFVPDFTMTIDPNKGAEHFALEYVKKYPMILKLESNADIVEINKKRKIFSSSNAFLDRMYASAGVEFISYNAGASVATAAFNVCRGIHFNRIVLVGQDLAYDGEASHVGAERQDAMDLSQIREVEGIKGDKVKTRFDWKLFLDWFEYHIGQCKDIEVIDATEGGAKKKGTKIMDLKEVVEQYCQKEFNVEQMLDKLPSTLDQRQQQDVLSYLNKCYKELECIEKDAEKVNEMIEKGITLYQKRGMTIEVQAFIGQITKLGAGIEKAEIYSLIDTYMCEFARNNMSDIYKFTSTDDEVLKTLWISKQMYQGMREAIMEIRPLLEEGINGFRETMKLI